MVNIKGRYYMEKRNDKRIIQSTKVVYPQIYAYTLTDYDPRKGWIKIGYTERKNVDTRIKEQTHTAAVRLGYEKLWAKPARYAYKDVWFKDYDFHTFLTKHKRVKREEGSEWFYYNSTPENAGQHYEEFINFNPSQTGPIQLPYVLRSEQEKAVAITKAYADTHPEGEFLWNAKPRFGKTLTTYDLIRKMKAEKVLIVTNRPAIANSWYDDFEKFIAWQTDYRFVSESESLKDKPTLTREEFFDAQYNENSATGKTLGMIAFVSLQDLKGGIQFGGNYDKLQWLKGLLWDLVVIDEAHEGVDTTRTADALDKIKRNFTLHLSGTPFKALANQKFNDEQIYNWTYVDEQRAKLNWDIQKRDDFTENPYAQLPELRLFSYQMSPMITDRIVKGANIDGEELDFAFDLNEFFATDDTGKFVYERYVLKWLDTLSSNEKYPFSTEELRKELRHTFWLLQRVSSAKALAQLLIVHPVFKEYEIIVAAGDGRIAEDEAISGAAFDRVREAIDTNEKTITLSVGQLTTGITIPEWTAVLMLSNIESPVLYMQSAFRAQNPWLDTCGLEPRMKENAYIFDFAPERTLLIFDEFANNLSPRTAGGNETGKEREENVQALLNFFPVIAEDLDGKMIELDAQQVLTMPAAFKAREVVSRGFMSNLLFQNVSGIFSSERAKEIIGRLTPTDQGRLRERDRNIPIPTEDVSVNDEGEIEIPEWRVTVETNTHFGDRFYGDMNTGVTDIVKSQPKTEEDYPIPTSNTLTKPVSKIFTPESQNKVARDISKNTGEILKPLVDILTEEQNLSKATGKQLIKKGVEIVATTVKTVQKEFAIDQKQAEAEYKKQLQVIGDNPNSVAEAHKNFVEETRKREEAYQNKLIETVTNHSKSVASELTHEGLRKKEEEKKNKVEDEVRARLRGFARTIPSFLMAYGDENTNLSNFDVLIEPEVFLEVTGIKVEDFIYLRDDEHFFQEITFNESVQEFLRKRKELANYFDESLEEDIFDYIPPQKTNQIFTPKAVVKMMIDKMEEENPNIFSDSKKTYADLYMKSGLYIVEIVKRLYKALENEILDSKERLQHIFDHQVYGFAPTKIIHRIASRFIFGFDEATNEMNHNHIVHLDTLPYAKGELDVDGYNFEQKCDILFGKSDSK